MKEVSMICSSCSTQHEEINYLRQKIISQSQTNLASLICQKLKIFCTTFRHSLAQRAFLVALREEGSWCSTVNYPQEVSSYPISLTKTFQNNVFSSQ